jgi:prophage antirepressor-like protein
MKAFDFDFKGETVTTFTKDDEIFFSASSVCKILGLKNSRQVLRDSCDPSGVRSTDISTAAGKRTISIINEENLYRLIFKSRKETAKKFQKWVFSEVLPSIRKSGKYSIPESIKKKSTKDRNILTDAWKECGINSPKEYAQLTLEEYKQLGFEEYKRKYNMDKGEMLLLNALESMESLNLFYNPKEGFVECKDSLGKTAKVVQHTTKREIK